MFNEQTTAAVRPRLLISRCITFDRCRWNGAVIASPHVDKLKTYADFVTVCPEAAIGLGIPRKPVRLITTKRGTRMIQFETGYDATDGMEAFSASFIDTLGPVDGILLKERSPSCGIANVKLHSGGEKETVVSRRGTGLFAARLKDRCGMLPVSSEGRLNDFFLREHFYTQIWTLARFRAVGENPAIGRIVDFHASHKLLLMSCHQTIMRRMGRIVANHDGRESGEVCRVYFDLLCRALARPPRRNSPVNVLMHALGYFSEKLTAGEKRHLLTLLERYREGMAPLAACNAVVRSWIVRFDERYLASQFFFRPYPEPLVEVPG